MSEEFKKSKYSGLNKGTIFKYNIDTIESYNFENFDIKKDMDEFRNFNMTITSKTNSGKSVFMKDICNQIKSWFSQVYLMSVTADLQKDLYDFIPKSQIYNSFNETVLQEIWKTQELVISKNDKNDSNRVLVIYDDLISDPKVRNSKILKKFFCANRQVNISQIFLSQSFKAIPPVLRENVTVAVSFFLDSEDDRIAFSKSYLSVDNAKQGLLLFDKITKEPYQSIVCMNCLVGGDPEKYIRTYVANLKVKKFKMF